MKPRISACSAKPRASSTNSSRPGTRATRGNIQAPKFQVDVTKTPMPRFDLLKFDQYLYIGVQFSRGCPFTCEFCDIIELYGRAPRTKRHEQMLAELETLYRLGYRGHVDFVDDNLIGNKKAIKAFLPKLQNGSSSTTIRSSSPPRPRSTSLMMPNCWRCSSGRTFSPSSSGSRARTRKRSSPCARNKTCAAASPTACTRSIRPACPLPQASLSASTPKRARSPNR